MNTTPPVALQFVPLFVMLGLYTVFVKLAALVTRLKLSWTHSFLFASILAVVIMSARAAAVLTEVSIPLSLGVIPGVAVNLGLAGWFLRKRATRRDGQPAGVLGGMKLGAVMCVLFGGVALVLMGILGYARALLGSVEP